MKKIFAITIFFMFVCSISSNAQKSVKFGLGPSVSLPLGFLGDAASLGLGAEFTMVYPASETFEVFAQTGVQQFLGKTVDYGSGYSEKSDGFTFVPFLVGGRAVSGKFLGGAALGYGNYGSSMSGFTFSPQFGIRASKMDVILNYTSTSFGGGGSLSSVGIKTAYRF
jgi:hypothetical protein